MDSVPENEQHSPDRGERIRRLIAEVDRRRSAGEPIRDEAVLADHPELMPELESELRKFDFVRGALDDADTDHYVRAWQRIETDWARDGLAGSAAELRQAAAGSPGAGRGAERPGDDTEDFRGPGLSGAGRTELGDSPAAPATIGRYRIRRVLGEGTFGCVYLAQDDELARSVAIKVPRAHFATDPADRAAYVAEARIVASLDHPGIVPVYDIGWTDDGCCYVVSKLIPGSNLALRLQTSRPTHREAARIVGAVAEALHYAHQRGLVHRDIKPANILLDPAGRPYVADFGLARRASELSERRTFAGTPTYMSPEQARGESHRVDGRSDIFSLGVVLYELLTSQRPFSSESYEELLHLIVETEPRRPRQLDASIPEELERICLKALSKRAADRYPTAAEMGDDLQHYLTPPTERAASFGATAGPVVGDSPRSLSRVIPKGLRPFDANDADYFLELLPGPRDRSGLPENLRAWKFRLEARDATESFSVGVLYGPSGCGKSSFVRAGLLPRLESSVLPVYLEATSEDTETRLQRRLAQRFPELPAEGDLAESLSQLRLGAGPPAEHKVLLVLDQFEQWLHGKGEQDRRRLVQALRQCDGTRLECLLLVRDDFWLALSRFMGELEVDLMQGRNTGLVDLFDLNHAGKVLVEFGRAYGQLPPPPGELTSSQSLFVQRAVAGLAQEERVVPVRLALFAEMVKGRPWSPATLREVGGAAGVGVAFLEETFTSRAANPLCRLHQEAARAVLESLLPESGSEIKGRMRSQVQLLDISGYGTKPRAFSELLRLLDAETRLITPCDPEAQGLSGLPNTPGLRYYQLTHDYLVPSLREWLLRKQKLTRSGRGELRLAERAKLWQARPEIRQLPSLAEWLSIRLFTRSSQWTPIQQAMMRVAGRYHALVLGCLLLIVTTFLFAGVELTAFARSLLMRIRARSANALLALGREETVWSLLQLVPDPTLRTSVIHGVSPLVATPEEVVARLPEQEDVSVRRAMLLLAGELAGAAAGPSTVAELRYGDPTQPMIQSLLRLYRDDPDAGMHSAAEWTLRRFGHQTTLEAADTQLLSRGATGQRQWYVSRGAHTMVVIPGPASFRMGSAKTPAGGTADERLHSRWIPHGFCIASKETSVAQFQAFLADNRLLDRPAPEASVSDTGAPQGDVNWFEAAAYCNWLSAREGIAPDQWCYTSSSGVRGDVVLRPKPDCLELRGYRLPTEAEWEYACRAGTEAPRYFGDSEPFLERYAAVHSATVVQPLSGCSRKPNDFGLFDMYGNVAEWCHDAYRPYPETDVLQASWDMESGDPVTDAVPRVVRGGSWQGPPSRLRSAARDQQPPSRRLPTLGFRVARTFP